MADTNRHPRTVRFFLYGIYGWVVCNTLLLIPKHNLFWGVHSFIPALDPSSAKGVFGLFYLLNDPAWDQWYPLFLAGQMLSAVLCLWKIEWRWPRLLVLFFTYNLDNRAFLILDGGNNIIQLMLIYSLFMSPKATTSTVHTFWTSLSNAFSNMTVLLARIQVVLIYLVAGLNKVTGETWQNGTALFYTLNVDEYSFPWASALATQFYPLTILGAYLTVLFQISFPWLVWFRKSRPWMLAFGSFLHLQISFVMGLVMFGFAMITCYLIFWEYEDEKKSITV